MPCVNCQQPEEFGGHLFQNCEHFACYECIAEATDKSKRSIVRCASNIPHRKISCFGFLRLEDIKWIVPDTIYDAYVARINEKRANSTHEDIAEIQEVPEEPQPGPSSSSYPSRSVAVLDSEEDDDDIEVILETFTFLELDLSDEEKSSGWGQVVFQINDFMETEGISFSLAVAEFDTIPIWEPILPFTCLICADNDILPELGVILKECFHIFCKNCLEELIKQSTDSEVKCPFADLDYSCPTTLKPNEVKMLVSSEEYERHYVTLALSEASKSSADVYNCRTPDCEGWCYIDVDSPAGIFTCETCGGMNCIGCKVLHEGTCAEYWHAIEEEERRQEQLKEDERNRVVQRQNERQSEEVINGQLNQRNFMRCPHCSFPCYKFTGCNHVTCGSCKRPFDWTGNNSTATFN